MSAPHIPANRGNASEIKPERWISFLAEFTRDYRGAHARLEVLNPKAEVRRLVPIEDRAFDGVSADVKDEERTVWLSFGAATRDNLTHSVHRAAAIRSLPPSGGSGAVLEIEGADGSKTVLELTLPENYALPSGESGPSER